MKNLTITYGDLTLFDGDVDGITWTDAADQVSITAVTAAQKVRRGNGLIDLLAGAAAARRQAAEPDDEAEAG